MLGHPSRIVLSTAVLFAIMRCEYFYIGTF